MTAQWGFVARIIYKLVRPKLQKIVEDSTNTADDTLLKVADYLAGCSDEQSK
jgi:hypothetical protein